MITVWYVSSLSCYWSPGHNKEIMIQEHNNCCCIWFAGWYRNSSLFLVFENNEYDSIMASWRLNWPWQSYCVYDSLMRTRKASVTFELEAKRLKLRTFLGVVCPFKTPGFYSCHIFPCCLYKIIPSSDCFPVSVEVPVFLFIQINDQNIFLNIFCVIFYLYTVLLIKYLTRAWYFKC